MEDGTILFVDSVTYTVKYDTRGNMAHRPYVVERKQGNVLAFAFFSSFEDAKVFIKEQGFKNV